jgi:hypothetical protein
MLYRSDGAAFAVGRARFLDQAQGSGEPTGKIYVKFAPRGLDERHLAQVDTGAAWSILDAALAEAMNLIDGDGEPISLSTRVQGQPISGRLERTTLTLFADEGESVDVEATVFVSRDWPAGNFLGYEGLLSRLRFAVDPSENFFYFGPTA